MNDYKELTRSWGALLIAICFKRQITPEQAFSLWDVGKCGTYKDDELNTTIIQAKKDGMSYADVGRLVGLSKGAVFKRIEYYAPELINRREEL